jgi:cytochrome c553
MTHARILAIALSAVALVAGCAPASAADVAAGRAFAQGCAACHGADGVSTMPLTPSLAGEPDYFIQWQLVFFRNGTRKNEVMGPIAESLNDDEIRNLGAYYASLPPPEPEAVPPGDDLAAAGAKLAFQHRCKSCHGDDFAGAGPAARLAGQREDVLLKALRDFKSGTRVGSGGVASMADVMYALNDADMQALAHYMASRQ